MVEAAEVSLNRARQIDQTQKREAADGPRVASMTSLNLPERTNELSEGVIRPSNATREGRRGSISEIPACTPRSRRPSDRACPAPGGQRAGGPRLPRTGRRA